MKTKTKYGFLWVTSIFLLVSLAGHWIFGWFAYIGEQNQLGLPIEVGDFVIITLRDMFENWQSEFLQLIWQVAGLTLLWYVGSPQSRESSDRMEDKVDHLLELLDSKEGHKFVEEMEKKYPKK